MKALEIAKGVQKLFEDPTKWTKGEFARAETGERVVARGDAACFCVQGAVDHVSGYSYFEDLLCDDDFTEDDELHQIQIVDAEIRSVLVEHACTDDIVTWNDEDDRTIDDVRDVIKTVVERLEAKGTV